MPPADSAFAPAREDRRAAARAAGSPTTRSIRGRSLAPVAAFGGAVLALIASARRWAVCAFVLSCVAVAGVVLTAGFALFPFVMPSSSDPKSSLTVWDSVSSHRTLQVMFWAVLIFLPLIIVYTSWVVPRDARQGHRPSTCASRPHSLY